MHKKSTITRITTWIAGVLAVSVALILPLGYFVVSYQYMVGSLETEAEVNAIIISQVISANPMMWRYEQLRLEELLARRSESIHREARRILDPQNRLIAENVHPLKHPLLKRAYPLLDAGECVATLEISRSLHSLMVRTGLVALLGGSIGCILFITLRVLPIRAVIRAEKSLREANEFLNKVMESTTNAISVVDREGKIILMNRRSSEISGYSTGALIGQPISILFPADRFSPVNEHFGEIMTQGVAVSQFEAVMVRKDGRMMNMECGVAPLSQEDETVSMVLSAEDITERKRAEGELKTTQMQLLQQEKMASIGQLAAGVAHEINNPMGFISSNLCTLDKYTDRFCEFIRYQSEALAGSRTAEEVAEKKNHLKLDRITTDVKQLIHESLDGAERVKKIVQNLKSFSRLDEAELKYADINECLESTVNIVWNELKYKATLNRDLGAIPQTKCYPQQLNQVFMNLLVNAAHAIEKQGEITVRTWREDGFIHVSVSDTGCGIPEKIRDRIFEPFYTTKEVGKGTGLGLSISYDIVKKHNGEILVESEAGRGTTFTVRIPVAS
ncbi:MAG: two-component system NtrC family sensor [Geobacteraceae bacterium]|nr:MAG: two-component system NtrC family sensor [Geobacteraceae bacterium]